MRTKAFTIYCIILTLMIIAQLALLIPIKGMEVWPIYAVLIVADILVWLAYYWSEPIKPRKQRDIRKYSIKSAPAREHFRQSSMN